MYFYIDEAGDFTPPRDPGQHAACVIMGVAVSDAISASLEKAYQGFVQSLSHAEVIRGEPKGNLITPEHQADFCDLLASFDGISLTPVTLDMETVREIDAEQFRQRFHDTIANGTSNWENREAAEKWRLLARQAQNLSLPQLLRIHGTAYCVQMALHHAIIFLSHNQHADSWHKATLEIDRVQVRPGSREERVFSTMMFSWLQAWSRQTPQPILREIHTPDHPFMRNFDTEEGISTTALFGSTTSWVDSRDSWGVQLADISAAIVHRAVNDLDDRHGAASLYASLMRSSKYGPGRGPALYSPVEPVNAPWISGKYLLLSEVMKRNTEADS